MITYYCPNCWKIVKQNQTTCPECGFALEKFSELSYEDKLLSSLRHTVLERRIIAAQILGDLKNTKALKEFKKIVESQDTDYFFMRVVLTAVASYDHPDRKMILENATNNPSNLISTLAEELLSKSNP